MKKVQIVDYKSYSKLVNNGDRKGTFNEYLTYKESFSPKLFDLLTKEYNLSNIESIYDPFMGTGSIFTNNSLTSCYGEDVNPLSIAITKAKFELIDNEHIKYILSIIDSVVIDNYNYDYPEWEPYKKYAEKEKYNIVMNYINFYSKFECSNFIEMVIISNLDKIFNYKRDGNGIKFRESKIATDSTKLYLDSLIKKALTFKLEEQKKYNIKKKIYTFNKTSVLFNDKISNIDVIITSPPYCNMFDYFEVYKMELWTSKIVTSKNDMKTLKKSALRSNFNSNINSDLIHTNTLAKCISLLEKSGCEYRKIKMIYNYFYDMDNVIKNSAIYLKKNGYMFIIVGNSFYNSKPIITDVIISELAAKHGFETIKIMVSRKLSTSPQQMVKISESDKQYLRESIVVLRRL